MRAAHALAAMRAAMAWYTSPTSCPAPCTQHARSMPAACPQHACNMPAACLQHARSMPALPCTPLPGGAASLTAASPPRPLLRGLRSHHQPVAAAAPGRRRLLHSRRHTAWITSYHARYHAPPPSTPRRSLVLQLPLPSDDAMAATYAAPPNLGSRPPNAIEPLFDEG